tara:strand:- start:15408 stop:15515 length:108 start_codon:yes stop_codon:yes gene_type:complete
LDGDIAAMATVHKWKLNRRRPRIAAIRQQVFVTDV